MADNLYNWYGANEAVFLLINGFHSPFLDRFMLLVTSLGHPRLFPFYMAAALIFAWFRPAAMPLRNVVVLSVSYLFTSVFLVPILKAYLDFPRPLAVLGKQDVTVLGSPDTIHAFPSGHSAYAVLLAASLAPGTPLPFRAAVGVLAILVCVSRVHVGAHFPADVVGGALISLAVVYLARRLIRPPRTEIHPAA